MILTREDHISFLQKKAIDKRIHPKATKSTTIHLMSITSKVISSYSTYHGDQSIWEKHISKAYATNAVYDTKMQAWYDTQMKMQHAYVHKPSQPKLKKDKTTPNSPRKRANVAWSKGLVRISASYFSVGTWMRSMFPFSTLSLRKWYLTSICLVLEWSTGVFGNTNGTRAITHERYIGTLLIEVTQCVCDPKPPGATTSGSNILSFCGRVAYTRLFARGPQNRRRT
jgi:hypothetical protein